MHPALSVIFFTTASGAGYGLLVWAALAGMAGAMPARVLLVAVALALVLVTAGLASSFLHLGKPLRAWRAFSQWRTSWLSREGLASMLTYLPALALGAALLPGALDGTGRGSPAFAWPGTVAGLLVIVGALATLACTAMIYASLKPIPAWTHRSVLPVYLVFALFPWYQFGDDEFFGFSLSGFESGNVTSAFVLFLLASFSASGELPIDKNVKLPNAENVIDMTDAHM